MTKDDTKKIEAFEAEYGKLHLRLSKKLLMILDRKDVEHRDSGLTLLALQAFPSSPIQLLIRSFISHIDRSQAT